MVGATSLFPVPRHVFPLEVQTRRGGHPDRTRGSVAPTDLIHWSGWPAIHADFSSPPPPSLQLSKINGRVDRLLQKATPTPIFPLNPVDPHGRPFKKKTGSRSANLQKSPHWLLRISKNVQVPSRQCKKKIGSIAEDYKKSSGRELRFPEKQRIGC
jgi:hypothetical protein